MCLAIRLLLALATFRVAAGTLVSVNKVELLWERITTGGGNVCGKVVPCPIGAAATRASMARAKALGFDVLRFGASGFWPPDQALYTNATTRPVFLAALDSVFDDAQALGVRLIPSLQWSHWAFVDLCHESLGADMMRDPTSCSHRGVQAFVSAIVERYSGPRSPHRDVVYAWELGNELNLIADISLANNTRLAINPALGTPAHRTAADNFTTADMVSFQQAVAGWVRKAAEPQRVLISSGNSIPRPAAQHLARSYHAPHSDWTNDTEVELQEVLQLIHTGLDLLSLHIYAHPDNYRFGKPPSYLLSIAAKAASVASIPTRVYLGEFGESLPDRRNASSPIFNFTRDMLAAAADASAQLATYWTWEDRWQPRTWSIHPPNATARNDEHTIQVLQAASSGQQ